jgi:hypothetical protein
MPWRSVKCIEMSWYPPLKTYIFVGGFMVWFLSWYLHPWPVTSWGYRQKRPKRQTHRFCILISIYNYIYVYTYIVYIYILWNSMNTYYIRSIVWFGYMLYTQTSRSRSGRPFGRRLGRSGSERDGYRSFAWYLGAALNIGSLKNEMVCEHLNQTTTVCSRYVVT